MAKLDFYTKEISNIQDQLIKKLDNIVIGLSSLSDTELIQLAKQIDFFDEMNRLGYSTLIEKTRGVYAEEIALIFSQLNTDQLSRIALSSVEAVNELIGFELTYLSNNARSYSDQLKNAMIRGVITGESNAQIIQNLSNGFGVGNFISSSESSFLINDAFATFSNATRAKVFEQFPNQKFKYIGVNDDRTRPACKKVLKIVQEKGSLTRKEIDKLRVKDFQGFSRRGGYNCRHDWVAV